MRIAFLASTMLFLLALTSSGCKGAANCDNTSQCDDGFVCAASGTCERVADTSDADVGDGNNADSPPGVCPADTHQCVAPPPTDWSGPVARTTAAAPDEPISCGTNYSTEVLDVFDGLTATGDCTCQCAGTASGTICSDSVAVGFNMASCQALAGGATVVVLGSCDPTPATTQSSYNWSPSRVTNGGTCAAAVVDSPIVPAFFAEEERFCETAMAAAGSCPDDDACTPRVDSGFEGELCIYQEGLHDCPGSTYTEKFTRYTGANDERACDTCSCDGPANNTVCASVTTRPSTSPECFNGIGSAIPANTCISGNFPNAFSVSSTDLRPFSCTASGGGVVGAATPTGPLTFCCQAP